MNADALPISWYATLGNYTLQLQSDSAF